MYVCDSSCVVVVCSLVLMVVVRLVSIVVVFKSHTTIITDKCFDVAGIEALKNS